MKNFAAGPVWLPGTIQEVRGPVTFQVALDDGRVVRRHVDHVRLRTDSEIEPPESTLPADRADDPLPSPVVTIDNPEVTPTPTGSEIPELR